MDVVPLNATQSLLRYDLVLDEDETRTKMETRTKTGMRMKMGTWTKLGNEGKNEDRNGINNKGCRCCRSCAPTWLECTCV